MKKGITLIELIIVLSIMSITFLVSSGLYISSKQYENKIKVEYTGNTIMMFINEARQYCKANVCSGYIQSDLVGNSLEFYVNTDKRISVYIPPEGIIVYDFGMKENIRIDKEGSTSDAGTIMFKDKYGISKRVTLRVGSEYVHFYK